jgi:hypothetical protein
VQVVDGDAAGDLGLFEPRRMAKGARSSGGILFKASTSRILRLCVRAKASVFCRVRLEN